MKLQRKIVIKIKANGHETFKNIHETGKKNGHCTVKNGQNTAKKCS